MRDAATPAIPASGRAAVGAFVALAIGHTAVGLVLFAQPLADVVADGVVATIATLPPRFDRQAAFWFLSWGPLLLLFAQVTARATARGDAVLLRTLAWYVLAVAVVGAATMPLSGFWAALLVGPLLFHAAARVAPAPRHGPASSSSPPAAA